MSQWLIWIVEILLEACLFGLAVFTLGQQKSTSEFPHVSRLVRSLYRHAIIFYLANTFSDIFNIITWIVFAGTPPFGFANAFTIALVNITGQRLAIDLRYLHIQKETTQSEVCREVAIQLAVLNNSDPAVP
ncbi:hypothetical protein HD554DRAFT_2314928 [Boletus coccyginus]|nr:hypothetical protein HD554DRAFT_2314928 [Boletus coccyginus]